MNILVQNARRRSSHVGLGVTSRKQSLAEVVSLAALRNRESKKSIKAAVPRKPKIDLSEIKPEDMPVSPRYINQLLHCIGFYSRVFVLFLFWRGVSRVKIKTKQIRVNTIQIQCNNGFITYLCHSSWVYSSGINWCINRCINSLSYATYCVPISWSQRKIWPREERWVQFSNDMYTNIQSLHNRYHIRS